jgi:predicted TPR repeat methyltransferase
MASHSSAVTQANQATSLGALYSDACAALQNNDLKTAGALAQQILQQDETYAPAYAIMADLYEAMGEQEKAAKFLDFAMRFAPGEYAYCFKRGQLAFLQQEWKICETCLTSAHKLRPKDVLPLVLLGDAYASQKKLEPCVKAFKRARAIDDNALVCEHEGLAMLGFGALKAAEGRFQHFLMHEPNNLRAKLHMSKILIYTDRLDDANALLQDVLAQDENNHEAHYFAALWNIKRENREAALKHIYRAVQLKDAREDYELLLISLLKELGHLKDCETVLRHMLKRDPEHLAVLQSLAYVLVPLKKIDEARDIIHKLLDKNAGNDGLKHILDAIEGRSPQAPPDAYVRDLFDHYADKFDTHLLNLLSYQTPYVMRDLILRVGEEHNIALKNLSLLDLGCGTGLGAQVLQDYTSMRVGVDLSPKILAKAEGKGLYDKLVEANIVTHLQTDETQYDLITALDVLVYIGDLAPLFAGMAARLNAGGMVAISVEQGDDVDQFVLRNSGRYAHAAGYVKTLAEKSGLKMLAQEPSILRKEGGKNMDGWLFVFTK